MFLLRQGGIKQHITQTPAHMSWVILFMHKIVKIENFAAVLYVSIFLAIKTYIGRCVMLCVMYMHGLCELISTRDKSYT